MVGVALVILTSGLKRINAGLQAPPIIPRKSAEKRATKNPVRLLATVC